MPRKPGMTRADLVGLNAHIVAQAARGIREHAPEAVVVVVTNPLDVMTFHFLQESGFPSNRYRKFAGPRDGLGVDSLALLLMMQCRESLSESQSREAGMRGREGTRDAREPGQRAG